VTVAAQAGCEEWSDGGDNTDIEDCETEAVEGNALSCRMKQVVVIRKSLHGRTCLKLDIP